MNATAWLVRTTSRELLAAHWDRDVAEEYVEDSGTDGLVIERLDFEVGA